MEIEETYQMKTQLEHILLRPDTYVGTIERITQQLWVCELESKNLVYKNISYVPALYKIFDEILVNAADNKVRDPTMNCIKVTIDQANNIISVFNNGKGIPVVIHQEHKMYIPEMIFGHLLTSTNYNDKIKKVTGGRNGYGAKLANIFSSKFTVETVDKENGKYIQHFSNNMNDMQPPIITSAKGLSEYTKITFSPDLQKFGMESLEDDTIGLMMKRVYDLAGITKVKVYLNDELIPINKFQDYVQLYCTGDIQKPLYLKLDDRWEIAATISDGGQHVNYISEQIEKYALQNVEKSLKKNTTVKLNHIKNYLYLFVNCLVENPAFSSQTKETLTTRPTSFGSDPKVPVTFIDKLCKSGLTEAILAWARFKQTTELKKKGGAKTSRLYGISKLDDANCAGTRESDKCTLILTEGDSAKTFAVSGLSVVGRDYYGVFPLRGKLLNVRDASHEQIMKNEEIQNIVKILGLKYGTVYQDTKSIRYGSLLIMTDQDFDGSHIKGLIMNFIHHFWPSLLKINGFLKQFITPIVKVSKKSIMKTFFTIEDYENWYKSDPRPHTWTIKYYKGLGTSSAQEAKEYFSDLQRHLIPFEYGGENDDTLLKMAFEKKKVSERKEWIQSHVAGTHMNYNVRTVRYEQFINNELVLFSIYDNERSIPCFIDGFKPSQRKILFAAFKRNLKVEIKVNQFSGYVSENAAYHHGEQSLNATIVNMSQNFVGSNNINLFFPSGQFGSRLMGGKDCASARYIYTRLETISRLLFHPHDDQVLNYNVEDGQSIEPEYYVPIIPTLLVNGSEGIGTGWSTNVPNYNPREIIANIRNRIAGLSYKDLHPWYRGFGGIVREKGRGQYTVHGIYNKKNETTIEITELPIGRWTQDYKIFLESLIGLEKQKTPKIKEFKENHTDTRVHFTVILTKEQMDSAEADGLEKFLKLDGSLSCSNMNTFDKENHIHKYDNPLDIIEDFYNIRLEFYHKRKQSLLEALNLELLKLNNKARFIKMVVDEEIVVNKRKVKELCQELQRLKFDKFDNIKKTNPRNSDPVVEGAMEENAEEDDIVSGYRYLLTLHIQNLTIEKVEEIKREVEKKSGEVIELEHTTPTRIWLNDLDALEKGLDEFEKNFLEMESSVQKSRQKNRKVHQSDESTDDEKPKRRKKTLAGQPISIPSQTTITLKEMGIDVNELEANKKRKREKKPEKPSKIALIEEEELSDDIESQLTDSSETEVKVKRKPRKAVIKKNNDLIDISDGASETKSVATSNKKQIQKIVKTNSEKDKISSSDSDSEEFLSLSDRLKLKTNGLDNSILNTLDSIKAPVTIFQSKNDKPKPKPRRTKKKVESDSDDSEVIDF